MIIVKIIWFNGYLERFVTYVTSNDCPELELCDEDDILIQAIRYVKRMSPEVWRVDSAVILAR
jgi:hypothetical protein